jgi:nucleotidyltransferase substrate binding protein (TIGR01987 family)
MTNTDIRWKQRFSNYTRAVSLLSQALENSVDSLNQLEQEGAIQRFEYTFELAWKTVKDRLESDGIVLETISPRSVLRTAFESRYINEIDLWMNMVNDRILMSHTYDFEQFYEILITVKESYLPLLLALKESFQNG